jgi:hypothetical protein
MCDHELSFRDKTLVQLDSFFLDLIENILAFVGEKTIRAKFTTIDDIKKTGRVDYLRFDKPCIKRKELDKMVAADVGVVSRKLGHVMII